MPRTLRVVTANDGAAADMTMADAIGELAAQCAADRPSCVLLVWERAEHGGVPGKVAVELRSLPTSLAVMRGLYEAIGEVLYPGGEA